MLAQHQNVEHSAWYDQFMLQRTTGPRVHRHSPPLPPHFGFLLDFLRGAVGLNLAGGLRARTLSVPGGRDFEYKSPPPMALLDPVESPQPPNRKDEPVEKYRRSHRGSPVRGQVSI
jgi:hypothetical protein